MSASSGIGRRRSTCRRSPNQARVYARSGDRLAIAGYLGAGSKFDKAIARFSTAYADQNELDHGRLADAVSVGEVAAETGV